MLLGRPLSLPEDSGDALQLFSEPLPAKIQGSLQVRPKQCASQCQPMGGGLPREQRNLPHTFMENPALSQAPSSQRAIFFISGYSLDV